MYASATCRHPDATGIVRPLKWPSPAPEGRPFSQQQPAVSLRLFLLIFPRTLRAQI